MAISWQGSGALGATATNAAALTAACTAVVTAGDILIAHVVYRNTTSAPATPGGWELLFGPADVGTTVTGRHWVFGKIADGTEDGTSINFGTAGGTVVRAARISRFAGRVSGTIFEVCPAASFSSLPDSQDPNAPTVTTTETGAMAIGLSCQTDDNALENYAGASGGTWGNRYVGVSTLGSQLAMSMNVCTPDADPGTVSGGAMSVTNDPSGTIGFEIRTQPDVVPPNEVTAPIGLALAVAPVADTAHEVTAGLGLGVALAATVAIEHEVTSSLPISLALAPVVSAPGVAPNEVTAAIGLGVGVAPTADTAHEVTISIPLTLGATATADTAHEVTASVPIAVDVSSTVAIEHEATSSLLLGLALAPVVDAPAPGAPAEVTASIPLALALAGTAAIGHEATAGIPLALGLEGTTQADHEASASIPLLLTLGATVSITHQVGGGELALAFDLGPAVVIDPSNLTPPPWERTVRVLAEDRTITVGLEDRTVRVLYEERTITVEG